MKLKRQTQYLKNVSTLSLDADRCVGCGMCLKVCPHGVFDLKEGKAAISDPDSCIECGACALNCAFSALSVNPGTGCAAAIINSILYGGDPECNCC